MNKHSKNQIITVNNNQFGSLSNALYKIGDRTRTSKAIDSVAITMMFRTNRITIFGEKYDRASI